MLKTKKKKNSFSSFSLPISRFQLKKALFSEDIKRFGQCIKMGLNAVKGRDYVDR
jgi:hypothetical protein